MPAFAGMTRGVAGHDKGEVQIGGMTSAASYFTSSTCVGARAAARKIRTQTLLSSCPRNNAALVMPAKAGIQ